MSLYNIVGSASLQAGQPEDISQVLANLQAIQTILNGGIDDVNVRSTAAIQLSKLNGYPATSTQFARGDGVWAQAGQLSQTIILNGTTSYVATTGANKLLIEAIGAGGGSSGVPASGATTQASVGLGGGGGGYARTFITANIGTHTVAVGAGGAAGAAGSNAGGAGGNTVFSNTVPTVVCQANGGGAGVVGEIIAGATAGPTFASGGSGGTAPTGDILVGGGFSRVWKYAAAIAESLAGDAPMYGAKAIPNAVRSGGVGGAAAVGIFPGGGSPGPIDSNNIARAGAVGGNGVLVVRAYT